MPKTRMLHPKFFTDAKLYRAEAASGLPLRLAYEGLWCVADREGRFEWEPDEIKLFVLPYDPVDMELVLKALGDAGFIVAYEVGGKRYGYIRNLLKWQHIHPNEAKSHIPAPTDEPPPITENVRELPVTPGKRKVIPGAVTGTCTGTSAFTSTSTDPAAVAAMNGSNGNGDNGHGRRRNGRAPPNDSAMFEAAWSVYPKRPNNSRASAWRAWQARVKEGESEAALLAGTEAYASYVQRERTEARFVKMAATFYGRDKHYANDYGDPTLSDEPRLEYVDG